MSNPLVSFIIPYYNSGATIQETIDSIFNQSYSNFDVWLINDGSTDQISIDKLKEFEGTAKIHLLHQENAGPSVARNKAIQLSAAEFIIPLDADDLVSKTAISESVYLATSDKEIGVVYGNLHFFGESTEHKIQQVFAIERQLLWNQIAVCCLIRKEVFNTVGYYDEHLSKLGLEDWEFWLCVGQSAWKFSKIEQVHFRIRVVDSSRTYTVANQNLTEIKKYVYKKHSNLVAKQFEVVYYEKKMIMETPDYRIGNFILKPYRILKKIFKNAL
jgi:glycosyltransferase involved in cell wall biosynthesis